MKIIISPAKKMTIDSDTLPALTEPVFADDAAHLAETLRAMDAKALKTLWRCSDKLTAENLERLAVFDPKKAQTPAILAYEGLQYQHLAPAVLARNALDYLQDHLRILSGMYGVLRLFDAVMPYRLEMQAKLSCDGAQDLYAYWGRRLYEALDARDGIILNLASEEYARAIRPYCGPNDRMLTVRFGEISDGRVKQKGTFAKMARGEMVRFMAEQQIDDLSQLAHFDALGLHYEAALSDDKTMTFLI
ncbi:MAG: peroxide stress protein YaaA [Peptococcaceae bacterium]|nr:peroxide stress protein YaaA [Peptococcaceae bacterium]